MLYVALEAAEILSKEGIELEVLDLRTGGFAQRSCAAEVGGASLDQGGIQLVLADDLAQTVADFGAAVIAVGRL